MKSWFPFTDYDFYAYLTAGLIVLFSMDYSLNNGAIMLRETWPFVQIIFVIAMSYLVGHVVASVSSILFEHCLARRLLAPPTTIQLNLNQRPNAFERFVGRWLIGRYYEPMPENSRSAILAAVANYSGTTATDISDPEEVFQVAFPVARTVQDAAVRMDDFRKLYAFSRNVALAGIIAAIALAYRGVVTDDNTLFTWAALSLVASLVLIIRFLKFYAAYAAEVLRTFLSSERKQQS